MMFISIYFKYLTCFVICLCIFLFFNFNFSILLRGETKLYFKTTICGCFYFPLKCCLGMYEGGKVNSRNLSVPGMKICKSVLKSLRVLKILFFLSLAIRVKLVVEFGFRWLKKNSSKRSNYKVANDLTPSFTVKIYFASLFMGCE